MKQRYPQEALFSTKDFNNEETNEYSIQELLESLSKGTYENIGSENYLNMGNKLETGAASKFRKTKMLRRRKRWKNDLPTNEFWNANGNHTKCFKTIEELQELSLSQNNPTLFYAICRVRILIENKASQSTAYMQRTLLFYWQ
jgi:hypothetical protein